MLEWVPGTGQRIRARVEPGQRRMRRANPERMNHERWIAGISPFRMRRPWWWEGGMEILSFSSNKTSAGDYVLRSEGKDDGRAMGFIKNAEKKILDSFGNIYFVFCNTRYIVLIGFKTSRPCFYVNKFFGNVFPTVTTLVSFTLMFFTGATMTKSSSHPSLQHNIHESKLNVKHSCDTWHLIISPFLRTRTPLICTRVGVEVRAAVKANLHGSLPRRHNKA